MKRKTTGIQRRQLFRRGAALLPALATATGVAAPDAGSALAPHVANAKEQFSFLLGEDFVEKHNVAWRVELAEEDSANPLLEPKFSWDGRGVFSHGTVMLDPTDGLWKAWYISLPKDAPAPSAHRLLTYAESRDGVRWERPELGIASYGGNSRTNILLGIESGGSSQHASVMVHPDAPRDSRYEMFIMRSPGYYCPYRVVEGFPLAPGEIAHSGGMYRYRSADGKRWKAWEQVKLETADSLWISQLADGSYVAYHKTEIPAFPGGLIPYDIGFGGCRIMARRTSKSGSEWSPFELAMTPDWLDAHDTQFMELTTIPQRGGLVGIATVYHALSQSIDVQFAASRDGKSWWRPDRRSCLPLRALGDYGGGMIWPLQPLIQHDGRIYLYYSGCDGLHNDYQSTEPVEKIRQAKLPAWPHQYRALRLGNDSYNPATGCHFFHGALCRASWQQGRLWAAVTASGGDMEGMLLTKAQSSAGGKELRVNARILQNGSLEAELVSDGKPIPGFARADSIPFQGDAQSEVMRWKRGSRCPADSFQVRFFLTRARLYGFDMQASS